MSWIFSCSAVGMSRVWLTVGLVFSLTAALLMGSPAPAGAVAGYGDVPESSWYTDAVQWSVDNAITDIAGVCFAPETPVSRGETAVWIYNMENQPDAGEPHSFTDVTDASQHDAVSWMANNEITTGTSPTTFAPDETLRRAQAAAFLHRLAGEPSAPAHNFSDVVTGWQQNGVSWMADTGITTGTSPTTFAPDDTLTRAQLITFLYRYKNKPDVNIDPSNPHCDPLLGVYVAVAAGFDHSCALDRGGSVTCWGDNTYGQASPPGSALTSITAGTYHSCGLRLNGRGVCWGADAGPYPTDHRSGGPFPIHLGQLYKDIFSNGTTTCAIRRNDTVHCEGITFADAYWISPNISAIEDLKWKVIDPAGDQRQWHYCGVAIDDSVRCWTAKGSGSDENGKLSKPLAGYVDVGGNCAISTIKKIACWDDGSERTSPPSGSFISIDSGNNHACALSVASAVVCWGDNTYGQADAPDGHFKSVSAGAQHSCAVRSDNSITCWGANESGQSDAPDGPYRSVTIGY